MEIKWTKFQSDPIRWGDFSPFKFYLAFENSMHCNDYLSEKFWRNSLHQGLVPVVYGPHPDDVKVKNWEFWTFCQNLNFCQKLKFSPRIEFFFKNWSLRQTLQFSPRIELVVKNLTFLQKLNFQKFKFSNYNFFATNWFLAKEIGWKNDLRYGP